MYTIFVILSSKKKCLGPMKHKQNFHSVRKFKIKKNLSPQHQYTVIYMFTESFHSECSLQPLKTISTPQLMYLVSVYPVNNINIEIPNSDLRRIADKVPSQYLISLGVFIIISAQHARVFYSTVYGSNKV